MGIQAASPTVSDGQKAKVENKKIKTALFTV